MADTTKSIKSATDIELSEILRRVRKEREILRILMELKTKSIPNKNGPYPTYNVMEAVSTETIIYDNKSIKQMTDDELNAYFVRLQNENEVAGIIGDIQRFNKPEVLDEYGNRLGTTLYEGVDLNTPVKDLYHFGIPGMHWGVRRASSKTTPKGSQDYLESRALKKKGIKNLSTAELKTLTTRKQLETNYKNLNPGILKKGTSAGKAVLAGMAAVTTVAVFVASPVGQKIIAKSAKVVQKLAVPVAKAAWKTVG